MKNVRLEDVTLSAVEGEGSELMIRVRAARRFKTGRFEQQTVEFKVCRYAILQLLKELKLMHGRDRERLARERRRIEDEIRALQEDPK